MEAFNDNRATGQEPYWLADEAKGRIHMDEIETHQSQGPEQGEWQLLGRYAGLTTRQLQGQNPAG